MKLTSEAIQRAREYLDSDGGNLADHTETFLAALDLAERMASDPNTFPVNSRVRKKSGAQWQGLVIARYYNPVTDKWGCNVLSDREIGNVQIYPDQALEFV